MNRVKTFDSSGVAPGGRLYAGDLNAIQDAAAALSDYSQVLGVGTVRIGEAATTLSLYAPGIAQLAGELFLTGALGLPNLTTTQRDAIAAGGAPKGTCVYNTTLGFIQVNVGTDGSRNWRSLGGWDRGTALPGSPIDGDEFYYIVDDTIGIEWHLKYDASQAKWRKVGGAPLYATISTAEGTISTTYVDLTTPGPSVTVPLTGSYFITEVADVSASAAGWAGLAAKLGAAATADAEIARSYVGAGVGNGPATVHRKLVPRSLTAADVVKLQYRCSGAGTATYQYRSVFVDPLWVI